MVSPSVAFLMGQNCPSVEMHQCASLLHKHIMLRTSLQCVKAPCIADTDALQYNLWCLLRREYPCKCQKWHPGKSKSLELIPVLSQLKHVAQEELTDKHSFARGKQGKQRCAGQQTEGSQEPHAGSGPR